MIFLKPRSIVRMGIILAIIGVILLGLSLYPTYTFLPSWSYWDSTVYVEGSSSRKICIGFIPKGSICVVKITVYSESPKIFAGLTDSLEGGVHPSVFVDESYSFVFQAPKDDFYYLYFDNSYTLGSGYWLDKEVFWQIYYYDRYSRVFQISGVLSLISGFICSGLYRFGLKGH